MIRRREHEGHEGLGEKKSKVLRIRIVFRCNRYFFINVLSVFVVSFGKNPMGLLNGVGLLKEAMTGNKKGTLNHAASEGGDMSLPSGCGIS